MPPENTDGLESQTLVLHALFAERVSPDNPANPAAVLCSRISEGAVKEVSANNYLHILDPKRNPVNHKTSVLPDTGNPILVVEGATDTLTALTLGFVAIGRPSAEGGGDLLRKMPLANKEVWIIGDNDAGAGKSGMDKTFTRLLDVTSKLCRILPPSSIKDLREWKRHGLTRDELYEYVLVHGNTDKTVDPDVFLDDVAYSIADLFLKRNHTVDNTLILRHFREQWYRWNHEAKYEIVAEHILRGDLYKFLEGKSYIKETARGPDIAPYKPTARKLHDILDAMYAWCPVTTEPPVWLDGRTSPDPSSLLLFKNGMLDLDEYVDGRVKLHKPDPNLFTTVIFPYAFDPNAESELCKRFFRESMQSDMDSIRLEAQWFGYMASGDTSMEKLMLYTGVPRSGKSTTLEMLRAMLGYDQCVTTDFNALAKEFGRAPLVGKLAAIMGDAKTPRASEAGAALETILSIVGQDPVNINPKYRAAYSGYLKVRFNIAMNELPVFADHAKALVARTNILQFNNSFVGREDFSLKGRLIREAAEGKLINFALRGYRDLRKCGRFIVPPRSEDVKQQFALMVAPVTGFIEECLVKSSHGLGANPIPAYVMYDLWQEWCVINGYKPGSQPIFARRLLQSCPFIRRGRVSLNNKQVRCYRGAEYTPIAEEMVKGL